MGMKEGTNMLKHKSKNRLKLAFFLNFGFSILEVVGGVLTNSIALLSDAVHDIGDSFSIGMSWFLNEKAKKKPDSKYTYGYARYSLLGGFISAIVLLIGSTILIIEAIPRILSPEDINTTWLIGFAIVGVVVNSVAAFTTSKGHSLNEKMVSLHLFEDVFGWVALLISAIVMSIWDIPILDPILSILFTLYILTHVYKNVKAIFEVFLEKAPTKYNIEVIKSRLEAHPSVLNIHHIHLWSLEGNLALMTFHAQMRSSMTKAQILETQNWMHSLLEEFDIHHATIEFEYELDLSCEECDPGSEIEEHPHHHH